MSFLMEQTFFYHFGEFFFANFILFSVFYAGGYGDSALLSHPCLLKTATSFTIFSFLMLLGSLKFLCKTLSYSLFLSVSAKITFFSLSFKFLIVFSGVFLLLLSRDFLNLRGVLRYEYDIFFCFSILGLFVLISANDFLMIFLAIEMQGLSFYLLAAFQRDSEFSAEAGLKYFVLGAFSSGLLLFGFFLLYLTFGTSTFELVSKLLVLPFSSNFVAF
jgi:NADH:ubiquinone oxidoreductase subunit 2 (subunit N)